MQQDQKSNTVQHTSRSENALRNMRWGFISKIVLVIFPFILRAIIIQTIGVDYLGLNGLFASILQVLSLAELGFGEAMVFSMYSPIAKGEHDTVCALLRLYRKIYNLIGIVMLVAGLAVMPFLPQLIRDSIPSGMNLYMLYAINLGNTVVSYFLFAYKQSLLTASQRVDISSKINFILKLIMYFAQIILLITLHSYYAYLIVMPIVTIISNLMTDRIVRKQYPQYVCSGELDKESVKNIEKRVAGLFTYKLCGVFRNSFDSVIISAFIGLVALAKYQNYLYIVTTVSTVLAIFRSAITPGIGNSIATESVEKNQTDFNRMLFIYMWLISVCTVCMMGLYQPFMLLWVKDQSLLLSDTMMICFCIYFFVMGAGDMCYVYRQASGLWWQDKMRPLVETVVNLTLNILLVKYIGMAGVLLSTIICLVFINWSWGSHVLYKHYFKRSMMPYMWRLLGNAAITAIASLIAWKLCMLLPLDGLVGLIVKGIICVVVSNICLIICYARSDAFHDMIRYVRKQILHK